ncbi:MAG: Uma2 family endonuclease [bacterium]|nr:Uma2 family endonuclease [bacterium]
MGTSTLVSVNEYLSTSYDPDREYVDGVVVERNLGERDHSELQTELSIYFGNRRKELGLRVYVEQRVQVKATRFRIPDVCVVLGGRPSELIFTKPPFICIEILSKDDRFGDLQEKIDDYLEFGVGYVWVIDPRTRRAWVHTSDGAREAKDGVLRTSEPEIIVPLARIFAELEA